jgi:serine/threonine protein kinase
MINKQLLSYKIISVLGEGGMGTVYLAEHTNFDRKVAIKAIHPHLAKNDEIRQRFKNEAATMARLQHPNIVSLYDYFVDDEGLYLIMELVEGIELESYLKNIGSPLDEHVTAAFMKQLLDAFSHAHEKGVVHRDIKPANILITNDGSIKVLDFGIAKIVEGDGLHNMTKTGTQIGTVYYMSPEQVQGKKVDARSDIYSLGVTFYQMLTAQNPYSSSTTEFDVYSKIVQEQLPNPKELNPTISDVIVSILNKATAKDPDARFQTCEQFKQALLKKEQQTSAFNGNNHFQQNSKPNSQNKSIKSTTSSGVATASLVLGIIGFIFCWFPFLNLILGILSFVFGIKGQKDSDGNKMSNAGSAVAGIVLGSITLFVTLIQLLFLLTRI